MRKGYDDVVNILVAGDLCVKYKEEELICAGNGNKIIEDAVDVLADKDLSIVNMEMALTDEDNAIAKSGACIRCKPECSKFIRECGFDIACLANNHVGDYGPKAVMDAIRNLNSLNIATVGAGENIEKAKQPLYIEKNNIKIAVLNYAEHEFGFATKTQAGTAPMDVIDIWKGIKKTKEKADIVLVILHGGNEDNPFPSPRMVKWYRTFAKWGANAVINIHPHCPQGYEVYNGVPILYSLGNFVFSRGNEETDDMWSKGYMAKLVFSKIGKVDLNIIPYTYSQCKLYLMRGDELEYFNKYLKILSDVIADEQELEKYWLAWCEKFGGEWTKAYLERTSIKNGIEDHYVLYMRNAFSCEAHNDLFTSYFRALCNDDLNGLEQYIDNIEKLQKGLHI